MSDSTPATAALWWHVYGAAIDGLAVTESGDPSAAWLMLILGESTLAPDDNRNGDGPSGGAPVASPLPYKDQELPYLGSFDHDPTDAEKAALTPEKYRDDA